MARIDMLEYSDGTNFLKKHMFSKTLSSDSRKMTIKWNCWAQAVPYSYSYSGKKRTGYYSGGTASEPGGIYKDEDNGKRTVRQNIFEGVRTVSIQYRKNKGKWQTIKPDTYDSHQLTFNSTKNGEVYDIKVTYALCTMGFPHRWYPFMWFGNQSQKPAKYKITSSSSKWFTDAKPYFPGDYYPCVPNAWKPNAPYSYTWGEPRTGAIWSKRHGKANPKTSPWKENYSCEYNATIKKTAEWTSEKGNVPQLTRKSSYFVYHRTFEDSYTTSGIIERPLPIKDPEKPVVTCIPAHGESGIVKVKYNHSGGEDGIIELYSVQKGNNSITKKVGESDVIDGSTIQFDVDFIKQGFIRSKEIRYYAIAKVYDAEYKTYRSSCSCDKSFANCASGHYFNDEPPAVNPTVVDSNDTTRTARITFPAVKDPDNDSVSYIAYIKSQNSEENINSKRFWGGIVNGVRGVDGIQSYFLQMDPVDTNYIDIDMTGFDDRERITVWIESTDNYINSYYYSSKPVEIIKTKSPNVSVKVTPAHGESGKLTVTYRHDKGAGGTVSLKAFQSSDYSGIDGLFKSTIKTLKVDSLSTTTTLEKTWTFDIDFIKEGFTRSRMIGYWADAVDIDGKKSADALPEWIDMPKGHYFNEEPPPVTPTVDQNYLKTSEKAWLTWGESIDPDKDKTTYEVFVYDGVHNNEQDEFLIAGQKQNLWYTFTYTTDDTNYIFDMSSYDASKMKVWIRTNDGYKNSYYYTGNILEFSNTGVAPYKPIVTTVPAHEEYGDLYINYSHPTGRSGKVYLYAIAKYQNGTRKLVNVFEKMKYTQDDYYVMSNGVNQPFTIDFRKLFGNEPENRSCDIHYYAIAQTVGFNASSEVAGWAPTVNMWEKWVSGHYYNEEPPMVTVTLDKSTDLHHNAVVTWNKVIDPDADVTKYYVYLNAKSDTNKKEDQFFLGCKEDKYLNYTHEYVTENNKLNISLDDFADDEEFELWIKSSDGYPNSYYYCSDMITFTKLGYHVPKVEASIDNVHGESGKLTVKYIHPDYGQEDRNPDDLNGYITVYAYVDDVYSCVLFNNVEINHNETKVFNVDFSKISKKRSCYISYFIVAKDKQPGLLSSSTNSHFASSLERIGSGNEENDTNRHYYNEEPSRVYPSTGQPDKDEDRPYYMFDYVNVAWDEATDDDGDPVYYDIYIKSIDDNAPKYSKSFDFADETITKEYNKYYRIVYDNDKDKYVTYKWNAESNNLRLIDGSESDYLEFKINYLDKAEGYPEPEDWKGRTGELWIVTTDGYYNSYYRCSPIYSFTRQKHEPPNKVLVQCKTAHEEKGDLTITYTHPEDLTGSINLYGYQEGQYRKLLKTIELESGKTESMTIEFINNFDRSSNISYYAIATDTAGIGLKSDDRDPSEIDLSEQATGHYFNDEPPAVDIKLVEGFTPFTTVKVKWDLVNDPDKDDVNYYIYLKCSTPEMNTKTDYFYGDGKESTPIISEGEEHQGENKSSIGNINYYNVYKITPQMEAEQNCHEGYEINISAFKEDERLEMWIQTRDDYPNSYYWSGKVLVFDRGHSASSILQAYPRTNTIVYAKTPRIVIECRPDDFPQEVLVKWGSKEYSNKTNPEYFSSAPRLTTYSTIEKEDGTIESVANPHYVVFRPPTPYTTKHNSKVPYSVRVNNTCSTSDSEYYTYVYKNFWNDFSDTKFIPLKSNHLNTFKEAVNDVRDAYAFETVSYNRKVVKDMVLDNEDYNSVDTALKDVNQFINDADPTEALDDSRTYITLEDGALVGYDSETDTDFTEWQTLLDLLENM